MLYMLAMVQPIMPLIEYQVNKDYIASVLCENRNKPELACNGKCYLAKEVKGSQPHHKDSHQHAPPQIDLSKYPVSLINSSVVQINAVEYFRNDSFFNVAKSPLNYSNSVFRPPIV